MRDPHPAVIDKFTVGFAIKYEERYRDIGHHAIRGRKQQLIDFHDSKRATELGIENFQGGAQSDTGPNVKLTENKVRGVAKEKPAWAGLSCISQSQIWERSRTIHRE